jgi:hypothetical protein
VVGCTDHMAACCLLFVREVYSDGSYHSRSSSDGSVWNIYLDIDWIHFAPLPFSHWDQNLLVRMLHPWSCQHHTMSSFCWSNFCQCTVAGQTLHITFFMGATISTLWIHSGLYFLLLQQQFCVSRYDPESKIKHRIGFYEHGTFDHSEVTWLI